MKSKVSKGLFIKYEKVYQFKEQECSKTETVAKANVKPLWNHHHRKTTSKQLKSLTHAVNTKALTKHKASDGRE